MQIAHLSENRLKDWEVEILPPNQKLPVSCNFHIVFICLRHDLNRCNRSGS